MTKDEKIEQVYRQIKVQLSICNLDEEIRKASEHIINTLEEPPKPTFRENEIVRFKVGHHWAYQVFKRLNKEDREQANKLSPAEVAATVAPMYAVRFEISDCEMCFLDRERNYCGRPGCGLYKIPADQWADLPDAEKGGEIK